MTQPAIFISYSRKDEAEKSVLLSHLGVLQGADVVEIWSDDRIGAGADWEAEISRAMAQAKVAILLVSVHFLISDFIRKKEVPEILRRRESEGLRVFPVIAKDCAWSRVAWLAKMNVRPKNGTPVWRDGGRYVDEELTRIVNEIADFLERAPATSPIAAAPTSRVKLALDACIARHFGSDQPLAALAILHRAFQETGVELDQLRTFLGSLSHDPRSLTRARRLLREPVLQKLARRAGLRDAYENLAFGE